MLRPVHASSEVSVIDGALPDPHVAHDLETAFGPTPKHGPKPQRGPIQLLARWVGRGLVAGALGLMLGFSIGAGAPLEAQTVKPQSQITATVKTGQVEVRVAKEDSTLAMRVLERRPLVYRDGADASIDRPPHVRAASGGAWIGGKLAVVQDDANFIAIIDPKTGVADALTLPAGADGKRVFEDARKNKKLKLDLEAAITVTGDHGPVFLGLGSGSLPARESIVMMTDKLEPRVVAAPRLYAALRAMTDFAGSELNVEGIVDLGDGRLRLFQRGNGKAVDGREPVNATVDLSTKDLLAFLSAPETAPVPALTNAVQYDLGKIDGVRVTFNDAVKIPGGILFLASAEDSPDAIRDGKVSGSLIGVIDDRGNVRYGHMTDEKGAPLTKKPEGMVLDPTAKGRVLLFTDADEGNEPAEMLVGRFE